jgi:hypothetical protein
MNTLNIQISVPSQTEGKSVTTGRWDRIFSSSNILLVLLLFSYNCDNT